MDPWIMYYLNPFILQIHLSYSTNANSQFLSSEIFSTLVINHTVLTILSYSTCDRI